VSTSPPKWITRLRLLGRRFERELRALLFACRDARVAWPTRLVALVVALYILSPIDLIPESLHGYLLGELDDLIVLTLGFYIAVRLVPAEVMAECRARAAETEPRLFRWWIVVPATLALQIGLALLMSWWTGNPLFPTGD